MKKKLFFCIIWLLAFGLWTSCSNSESSESDIDFEEELEFSSSSENAVTEPESSSSSEEIEYSIEGFVKQKGPKTVSLTDASDESNVTMTVQLDYDFYIGRTEVTREQYAALMGGDIPENEKKLPQVNVNFYDAVLYANALSKSEGRDTVYTYVSSSFTPSGSCAFLEGLARLPITNRGRMGVCRKKILGCRQFLECRQFIIRASRGLFHPRIRQFARQT